MKRPTLGQAKTGPVRIDVANLIGSRMLLAASSGGGKSWALRRILEQTHGHVQHLVLDPEGEFGTLRARLDYVLVGRGGDVPADPRSAGVLARRLLELGPSAVLDCSDLSPARPRPGVEAPRIAFVRTFLEGMVNAPRNLWRPVLVVLDEAQAFAPEKGQAESAAAVIDLMSRGRKRGYAGLLATQRLSKLSKDAAAEAQNVLLGRFTLDLDRKRAAEILGLGVAEARESIRRLKPGDFFGFGPALSEDVVRVRVGPVQTPHPKAGERAAAPPPAPAKVREALAALEDLAEQSEEEARTEADLRAKIADLERRLRAAERERPAPDPEVLERARREAAAEATRGAYQALRKVASRYDQVLGQVAGHVEGAQLELGKAADAARTPLDVELEWQPTAAVREDPRAARRPAPAPARSPARAATPPAEGIDGPMQRVLDALAWLESAGIPGPYAREQVAPLADYKPGTGAFQNALGRLRTAGLVGYPETGRVALEEAGRALARAPATPPTTAELHERILAKVDGPMGRCLRPLLDIFPASMTREELAECAGYQAGTGAFQNALGRLRTLGVIDYPDRGHAVALPVLFLEGR